MSTMLAAVLKGVDNLVLEEVPRPEPVGPGSVVVRIKSCGVCQTDYKAIKGIRHNVTFPSIVGHEPSGVVAKIGLGVVHFKEGDEVICQPSGYCGFCGYCKIGNTNYCKQAFTTGGDGPEDVWPGAFAEYMVTKESCLFHKPKAISFDAAAVTEPLSGAWKGVIQHSEMRLGDDVVVIGTGSIGMLCLMVARAAGAGRLIAVDTSEYSRKQALRLGADFAVDPLDEGRLDNARPDASRPDSDRSDGGVGANSNYAARFAETKKKIYEIIPAGPDLIVEAAGPIDAVKLMVSLLRRGTRWNVFGITTHETFELDGGLAHFMEARMDSSFGTTPTAMEHAIRLMERGVIDPEKIISHRFPLTDIHKAMEVMGGIQRNKIVINP